MKTSTSIPHMDCDLYYQLPGAETFRLLVLEPSPCSSDPVCARLLVTEPSAAPAYDAISYVWGDRETKFDIYCDGRPFPITANLHWALVRIRDVSNLRIVWADAICINQDDLQERSHQVTFMGSLYSHARNVYICMGDDTNCHAIDVKSLISDALSLSTNGSFQTVSSHNPLRNDPRWFSLGPLTENPWFQRTWVVQEAALAQNPRVLYGKEEFSYRDLIRVLSWLNSSTWAIRYGLSSLFIHLQWPDWRLPPPHPEYTFLELLSHASLLKCSDPRDKIYAFLGHSLAQTPSSGLIVKPDYKKHPKEVYLELSKTLIQTHGLRTLTMVEHTPETILDDLPSWVIQWDVSLVLNDIYRVPNFSFLASAGLSSRSSTIIDANSLIVRGVILDRVKRSFRIDATEAVGITFEDTLTSERMSLNRALRSLCTDKILSPYVDVQDAFCQTLCIGNSVLDKRLFSPAVKLATYFEKLSSNTKNVPEPPEDSMTYWSEIQAFCTNRSFVVTEQGFYCLGPLLTIPGDIPCVLFGVDVPFILRPAMGSQQFRLLGESYVHGVMLGQVHGMVQREELFEQTITIH